MRALASVWTFLLAAFLAVPGRASDAGPQGCRQHVLVYVDGSATVRPQWPRISEALARNLGADGLAGPGDCVSLSVFGGRLLRIFGPSVLSQPSRDDLLSAIKGLSGRPLPFDDKRTDLQAVWNDIRSLVLEGSGDCRNPHVNVVLILSDFAHDPKNQPGNEKARLEHVERLDHDIRALAEALRERGELDRVRLLLYRFPSFTFRSKDPNDPEKAGAARHQTAVEMAVSDRVIQSIGDHHQAGNVRVVDGVVGIDPNEFRRNILASLRTPVEIRELAVTPGTGDRGGVSFGFELDNPNCARTTVTELRFLAGGPDGAEILRHPLPGGHGLPFGSSSVNVELDADETEKLRSATSVFPSLVLLDQAPLTWEQPARVAPEVRVFRTRSTYLLRNLRAERWGEVELVDPRLRVGLAALEEAYFVVGNRRIPLERDRWRADPANSRLVTEFPLDPELGDRDLTVSISLHGGIPRAETLRAPTGLPTNRWIPKALVLAALVSLATYAGYRRLKEGGRIWEVFLGWLSTAATAGVSFLDDATRLVGGVEGGQAIGMPGPGSLTLVFLASFVGMMLVQRPFWHMKSRADARRWRQIQDPVDRMQAIPSLDGRVVSYWLSALLSSLAYATFAALLVRFWSILFTATGGS